MRTPNAIGRVLVGFPNGELALYVWLTAVPVVLSGK